MIVGGVALAAVLALAIWFMGFHGRGEAIDSIAVLPFVNASADPNTEYLSDGVTENLINSFSQLPKLRVIPRSRVFGYKGNEADPEKIGRELNVRAVLTGRVMQRGDSLNIQTELVDVAADSQLWGGNTIGSCPRSSLYRKKSRRRFQRNWACGQRAQRRRG
jgi:TolB-like protein